MSVCESQRFMGKKFTAKVILSRSNFGADVRDSKVGSQTSEMKYLIAVDDFVANLRAEQLNFRLRFPNRIERKKNNQKIINSSNELAPWAVTSSKLMDSK